MANEQQQGGPNTQEPDRVTERPRKAEDPEPVREKDPKQAPLETKPQIPDVNPPVQPGHRDAEQI
ncbi:MAG: hypothetical protein ACT4O1_16475 [Gemmatimonadota bacterium]